jgi:hypothetical protein
LEDARKFPIGFKLKDHRNSPRVWWVHEIVEYLERRVKTRTDSS